MLGSIKYNLAHLLDFSGRDARQTFWFYVLFLFIVGMALSMVVIMPAMVTSIMGAIQAAQATGDPEAINAYMAAGMGRMMGHAVWYSAGFALLEIPLLAASVVRRLHDSDLSGWWGLVPAVAQVAAAVWSVQQIDAMQEMMTTAMATPGENQIAAMQQAMSGQSLVGWIPLIFIVVIGVRKSTPGPNRYAAEPVRF